MVGFEIVFFDSIIAGLCSRLLSYSSIKNINVPLLDDEISSIIEKNLDQNGVLEYKIPKIEGYKANLSFYKVDEQHQPLSNIAFVLEHHDCTICDEVQLVPITMNSDSKGYVQFHNIPSGHHYVLKEMTPDAYAYTEDIPITVMNGQVYQEVVNDIPSPWYITNTLVNPIQIQLQGQKTMDGSITFEQSFQFIMTGLNQDGKEIEEITYSDISLLDVKEKIYDSNGNTSS